MPVDRHRAWGLNRWFRPRVTATDIRLRQSFRWQAHRLTIGHQLSISAAWKVARAAGVCRLIRLLLAPMRIALQDFLDLQCQAVRAAPHIGSPDRKPHPYARGNRDHRRPSTSSTRRRVSPSKQLPTRIRYLPATSISIVSATADGRSFAQAPSASALSVTGIRRGATGMIGAL